LLCAAAVPRAVSAQGLRDRVLAWPQGDFRAPLVCVLGGDPRQALRRVRIHPAPRSALPSVRVTFQDLEAPPGTTCGGVSNQDEPNVIGELDLAFEGRNQPDTGELDFRNALRRDGGFTFKIRAGRLRIGPAGDPTAALQSVDYKGGTARVESVAPGSDAARRLATFGSQHELQLELDADGARHLAFDLVELPPR
jgi:hypothetical protein